MRENIRRYFHYQQPRVFEYLNELFIKRHKKILWNSTKKISYVCRFSCHCCTGRRLSATRSKICHQRNRDDLASVFCVYHVRHQPWHKLYTGAFYELRIYSLLTYSFYKQPSFILRLFQIRLREIMKINAVPALVIGIGLALILFATGGTDNPLNYVVLIVSILCMSLFFSIHI